MQANAASRANSRPFVKIRFQAGNDLKHVDHVSRYSQGAAPGFQDCPTIPAGATQPYLSPSVHAASSFPKTEKISSPAKSTS
jgi:hypothetical protein